MHVEDWARAYITSCTLADKTSAPPRGLSWDGPAAPERLAGPGRPPELEVRTRARKSIRPGALIHPARRAELLHSFWHHELQAAELMAWAILAFADAPLAFRQGLLKVCRDEIRHMGIYAAEIERLGFALGDFPVRDWFWQRALQCETPLQFVSFLGVGLEGGNLDHGARFVELFEELGDTSAAKAQDRVVREEVGHVEFAMRWFEHWSGGRDFGEWQRQLVAPLSPMLFKGAVLNHVARRRAGMPEAFLRDFESFDPDKARARGDRGQEARAGE